MRTLSTLTAMVTTALVSALIGAAPAHAAEPSPLGANNWSCHPTTTHPDPVVLVHGLGSTMAGNWATISPLLASQGYCVFALTYGRNTALPFPLNQVGGLVPMEQSAQELSAFVDRVLAATGARKVDVVGHSEGSLMPDYYVKFLGGAAKVARYVGITPLWNGTNILGLATLRNAFPGFEPVVDGIVNPACGSCQQFLAGSAFLDRLNAGGAAVPGVAYTMIMTRYDETVIPFTSGRLAGATNIVTQDQCPLDIVGHISMAVDPNAAGHLLNALDPAHAVRRACVPFLSII